MAETERQSVCGVLHTAERVAGLRWPFHNSLPSAAESGRGILRRRGAVCEGNGGAIVTDVRRALNDSVPTFDSRFIATVKHQCLWPGNCRIANFRMQ